MDSKTEIANLRISGQSIFPDTTKVKFDGEDSTLKELLNSRIPFGSDKKISVEHLPDTLIAERGFSGAKLASVSNTVIVKKNAEQYIPFDQKVYDYGNYLFNQKSPPGGYKFCVSDEGLYGIGLELKFQHSPAVDATYLVVTAKIERADQEVYSLELINKNDITPGSTELMYTGVVEAMLEDGDCIFFVLKQDGLAGKIEGSFSTQTTIHKVVKVPEDFTENVNSGSGTTPAPGTIIDCEDVRDCFWCPDGITNVVNDLDITAPNGYLFSPSHSIALHIDNQNCQASLTGELELPPPSFPVECNPEELVSCISTANASPEDLGITFSQEQIMAIVGGFTTLTQFNALVNRVDEIENSCCD